MSAYAQAPPDGYDQPPNAYSGAPPGGARSAENPEDEWMRTFFQPQQFSQMPPQQQQQQQMAPPPQQQQQFVRGGPDPHSGQGPTDLYASTNSVGSDGAMSVLSNADDFSFDPSMVPQEWYGQQQQYSVIEIERQPQPQYDQRAMYQHQKPMHQHQPMQYEPRPVQYMERPMPVPQPRVEYVQQQMPPPVPQLQGPAVATVGIALWQQGRYLAIASITPGSDASQCGLKVGDAVRKIDGYSMSGVTMDQANTLLKGLQGTVVEIRTTWRKVRVARDCAAQSSFAQPQPEQMQMQNMMQNMTLQYAPQQVGRGPPQQVEYMRGPPMGGPHMQYQHMQGPPMEHMTMRPHMQQHVQAPLQHAEYMRGPAMGGPPMQYPHMQGPPMERMPMRPHMQQPMEHMQMRPPMQYQHMQGPPQQDYMFSGLPNREPVTGIPPPSRGPAGYEGYHNMHGPPPGYGPPHGGSHQVGYFGAPAQSGFEYASSAPGPGYGAPPGGYVGPGIDI